MDVKVRKGVSVLFILSLVFLPLGGSFAIAGIVCALIRQYVTHILAICFLSTGAGFLIAGFVCLSIHISKKNRVKRLIANGYYVTAEVNDITCNRMVQVNNRNPYTITAVYKDISGCAHIFKSSYLTYNPEPLLESKSVRVYTNRDDYRHYYMDLDSILPPVKIH